MPAGPASSTCLRHQTPMPKPTNATARRILALCAAPRTSESRLASNCVPISTLRAAREACMCSQSRQPHLRSIAIPHICSPGGASGRVPALFTPGTLDPLAHTAEAFVSDQNTAHPTLLAHLPRDGGFGARRGGARVRCSDRRRPALASGDRDSAGSRASCIGTRARAAICATGRHRTEAWAPSSLVYRAVDDASAERICALIQYCAPGPTLMLLLPAGY